MTCLQKNLVANHCNNTMYVINFTHITLHFLELQWVRMTAILEKSVFELLGLRIFIPLTSLLDRKASLGSKT